MSFCRSTAQLHASAFTRQERAIASSAAVIGVGYAGRVVASVAENSLAEAIPALISCKIEASKVSGGVSGVAACAGSSDMRSVQSGLARVSNPPECPGGFFQLGIHLVEDGARHGEGFWGQRERILLNSDAPPMFTSTIRNMKVSAEPGMEGVARAMGGIFELPDDDAVTVCTPVDHGYLEVRDAPRERSSPPPCRRSTAAPFTKSQAYSCRLKIGWFRRRSPSSEPSGSGITALRRWRQGLVG